jgi:ADP-heptose:LPS heptosyltransferase
MKQTKLFTPETIAVFRALQLGDMMCAIPSIRALHSTFPKAKISLIGLPWSSFLVERFPKYFHEFIEFPGYPGLPEREYDRKNIVSFINYMQNRKFDLLLQMQGNGTIVNTLMDLLAAKQAAGYFTKSDYCPNTETFMEYPDYGSEIHRHLKLMNFLGIQSTGDNLEFPIIQKDKEEIKPILSQINTKKYICIHPGARAQSRRWPADLFAIIADRCYLHGYEILITGSKEEYTLTREVENHMQYPAYNISGKTSIGGAAALIKNASLLISNDTGVMHLASALETPSVIISQNSDINRWSPLNRELHTVIDWNSNPDIEKLLSILNQKLLVKNYAAHEAITLGL